MTVEPPDSIVRLAEKTIRKFTLLEDREGVAVALSGGKDSLLLCLVLRALGYPVIPLIVDMGYEQKWGVRVAGMARDLGFEASTVEVRSPIVQRELPESSRQRLRLNLEVLNSLGNTGTSGSYTPCTSCYNSKVVMLDAALSRLGITTVAFGHHATDAASSLLKSAFMYIDRWDRNSRQYSVTSFREIAEGFLTEMLSSSTPQDLCARIDYLVRNQLTTTNEPPRQSLIGSVNRPLEAVGRRVIRPLFDTWESDLARSADELGLRTEPSGCGHSLARDTLTPREIVQLEVVRVLEARGARDRLHDWVNFSLSADGTLLFDARKHRQELLGESYKPHPNGIEKY